MFPSCGFLWSFPASTVCLFLCQPLSPAAVVNRADDCQLRGLCSEPVACEWQGEETLESEAKGDPSLSRKLLQAPARPVQKDLPPLTVHMELYRQKRHMAHSLHPLPGLPSCLCCCCPPPRPDFMLGRWQRGHSGFCLQRRVTNNTKHFVHYTRSCLFFFFSCLRKLELCLI